MALLYLGAAVGLDGADLAVRALQARDRRPVGLDGGDERVEVDAAAGVHRHVHDVRRAVRGR